MSVFSRRTILLLCCAAAVAVGSGCSKQARKNRLLERANRDFKAEQFDRAEIEYLGVLRVPPPSAVALANLGIIYQTQGKLAQGYHLLTNAIALDPANAPARLKLGQIYLATRDAERAHAEALEVIKREPGNAEALVLLVNSTPQTNLHATLQALKNLPATAKGTAAYHLALGAAHARRAELDLAETELQQAVKLDPKSSLGFLELANVYSRRKDSAKGEEALKTAVELAPLRSPLRVNYAEFKARTGKAQEARAAMEELTKKAPDYIPAWMFLSNLAFESGDTNTCASALDKLLARDPVNYDALLLKGKLLMARREATNAFNHFDKMTAVYNKSPELHYHLALASLAMGDVGKATASLNRSIAANTNYADPVLLLAELNIRRRNPAMAISSLRPIVAQTNRIDPRKLEAAYLLLTSAYAQTDLDQAVAQYQRMVQVFPTNAAVHMLMGMALKKERKAEARTAFEAALKIATNSLSAFTQLIDLDLQDRNFRAAESRVKTRIEQEPKAAVLHYLLGSVYSAQAWVASREDVSQTAGAAPVAKLRMDLPVVKDNVALAETSLLKSIELEPDLQLSYVLLSRLYVASSQHQRALERLNPVVERKTNDLVALTLIGMIQGELKNHAEAKAAYERCLEVDPRSFAALNNLAYLYSEKLNDLAKAYEMASRARDLRPQDPAVADTLGWVFYRRGEYARAIALLEDSQRGFSSRGLQVPAEVQFHLGMSYYMAGDEQSAADTLNQFLRNPDSLASDEDTVGRKREVERRISLLAIDPAKADAAALASLESALRDSPGDPLVLTRLAAVQVRDGSPDKALQSYKLALERNPQNAQVLQRMALLYAGPLKDSAKALELAREARKFAPQDPRIAHTLGRLAFQTRDFNWAASLLQEAARQLPNDPDVAYDLAWSHYSLGRVSQATEAMQSAVAGGSAFSRSEEGRRFLTLLELCKSAGDARQAASESATVLAREPDYVPALVLAASAQERQSNFSGAGKTYERVLALYPQFTPAMRNLARLSLYHLNDEKKAYDQAVKAREAFPGDPEVAKVLGILCYKRGEFPRSGQLLQESTRTLNADGEALYYLGMAFSKQKQRAQAERALESALSLSLSQTLADSAREELNRLKTAAASK